MLVLILFRKIKSQLNHELGDDGSESTEYIRIDECDSLKELDENVKKFRENNKNVKEKGKKIKIEVLDGENSEEDEGVEAYDEESLRDSPISSLPQKEENKENENIDFDD